MITHLSFTTCARTIARSAALTASAIGLAASLTFTGGAPVDAFDGELPVNELADEITTSADRAVAALEAYEESGDPADARTLAWHRAITARYTAQQLGYDELAMVAAWSQAPLDHQRAVLGALTQVGVPYRTNTSIEDEGFDCSGLTTYAWKGAGVELFRQSGSQISEAEPRTRDTAKAGDLVYYPGHVMLYLGVEDAVVHSVQTGRTVEIDTISARRRDSVEWGDPSRGSD
jgi:cell wall-associated NlpC family hydrolase